MMYLGYLMMIHMISCCKSMTCVLLYGRFLTKVFKDVNIDLSRETDFEVPSTYDMCDDQSMARMKFEKVPDGSWRELELDILPLQSEVVQFKATFSKPMMFEPTYTTEPSTQPSFIDCSSRPGFTEPLHTEYHLLRNLSFLTILLG
ncbi:hypothetical protein CK203_108075 [Vitis vinifera]|uniref:Uncharacterized protein n=1 Tax=Vitis vinifera TaxID=29760 RepID=A0A438DJE4_VITVI|nr:hypothetical protein CK203_108075 [Vitis vinifera]